MSGDVRRQIAEALAVKFTSDTGQRNPNWNPEQDESPDNPYHLTVPMAERVNRAPYVSWVAGDGCRSFSSPSCGDLADALMPVVDRIARERAAEELREAAEDIRQTAVLKHIAERLEARAAALLGEESEGR